MTRTPQRHPALQWLDVYVENSKSEPKAQIGAGAAWTRFAYDLFTIKDNEEIESRLKQRLLSSKDFQSARHELFVAALCVSADFKIEFEDETKNSVKHSEFIAVDRQSPARIAVEAKSRHRKGVKGFTGGKDIPPGQKVGIRDLLVDAFYKPKNFPLYIFVDLNLPQANQEQRNIWMKEISDTIHNLDQDGYDPCPANGMFFVNDPSHYLLDENINGEEGTLWINHIIPRDPQIPHPTTDILARFLKAWEQRNVPPENFPNF